MLGSPRCPCHAAVKCSLYRDALCGLFVQNRVLGTFQLGYLLSGSACAIFAPAGCTPKENSQADACVLPGPLLLRSGISLGQRGVGSTVPVQAGPTAQPCQGSGHVSWEAGDFTARCLFPELLNCRSGAKVEIGGALTGKWVLRGCCIRVVSFDHRTGHMPDQVVINALLSVSARQLGMGKAAG